MPEPRLFPDGGRPSGSALLITLLTMALMTIIVVAFLGTMTWEVASSHRDFDNQRARAMATLGMNTAVAQLRLGLGAWDNPFVNATNSAHPLTYYWSVSPGILTRWSYSATSPVTNYPLFSIDPNGATNLVNLNVQQADGTYPIAGGATPPNISVYWANVLQYPTAAANNTNTIVGRYAFWVDDENAKININTADGTMKYTTTSLGLGTPSEVSLQVLQQAGANLTTTAARNIVTVARTTGFNSPHEILRATGTSADLYTNNLFNITTFSRAPELNVFGEPKINMISASPPPWAFLDHNTLETNNVTGQALTEIYPSPAQLPALALRDPVVGLYMTNYWRPEVFTSEWTMETNLRNVHGLQGDRESWMALYISNYLGGHNTVGQAITWPMFAGATGTSFLGKYSLRQLDSLAVQITDLGSKTLFPEANELGGPSGGDYNMPYTVPTVGTGFLSHEVVSGLARSSKVNEIFISVQTYGAIFPPGGPYTPPEITMAIYVENYLPAGFAGVDLLNINNGLPPAINAKTLPGLGFAGAGYRGTLNSLDHVMIQTATSTTPPPGVETNFPSPISVASGTTARGYWADSILRNDQGIDFQGSPQIITNTTSFGDPDQVRSAIYHSYLTNTAPYTNTTPNLYPSAGPSKTTYQPILEMGAYNTPATPWYPGQYRAVENLYNASQYLMTNANSGTTLHISGGLIVTGEGRNGYDSDPDPTPLEAGVRGSYFPTNTSATYESYDNTVAMTNKVWLIAPGNANQTTQPTSPTETLISRLTNGVIPVAFSVTVPAGSTSAAGAIGQVTYDVAVSDPLVNKYPGDWIPGTNTIPTILGGASPTMTVNASGNYSMYYNDTGLNAITSTYKDPDSLWLPTLDPKIPRSARLPNIGYLNYLRTGIIPDNETVPINQQKGTPFRCLNFNAATDASQTLAVAGTAGTGYPDWALLDLFTVPSTLTPYGGPYGYYSYNTNNGVDTWVPGSIVAGNPTNMYYYGTWGGSTPGRINPNGAVIYTTNVNIPTPGIVRTLPLQALLHNLTNNATIASGQTAATATTNAPTFSGGTAVDDAGISSSIATYLAANGPFREPAEICDVPAISGAYPNDGTHYNPTRNDIVRQIVGNLTTQSNTFSVWVAGQTVTKTKGNSNFGIFESGDQITASVRYHFVVERYLQAGAGGVYGNPLNPLNHYSTVGTAAYPVGSLYAKGYTNTLGDVDGIVGTYDDPADQAYHPMNPRYLYRVIYAEEIRD